MRKTLLFALMMTLPLLTGCGGKGGNEALEQALAIRGEMLAQTSYTAEAALTADYGQRVYDYEMTVAADESQTTLTLTAPETVAGITARLTGDAGVLEYDGLCIETGPLNGDGLTPVSAVPALLEAARSGYITACGLTDDGLLRVDCGQPEAAPGTGTEYALWFDLQSHALVRGEVLQDGFRCITCTFLTEKES